MKRIIHQSLVEPGSSNNQPTISSRNMYPVLRMHSRQAPFPVLRSHLQIDVMLAQFINSIYSMGSLAILCAVLVLGCYSEYLSTELETESTDTPLEVCSESECNKISESAVETSSASQASTDDGGASSYEAEPVDDTPTTNTEGRIFSEVTALEHSQASVSSARIVVDETGIFAVVWLQYDGATASIYANFLKPQGEWETPSLVATSESSLLNPQVEAIGNGVFLFVWLQRFGPVNRTEYGVVSRGYSTSQGWQTTQIIFVNETNAFRSATGESELASDGRGNAVVTWTVKSRDWATERIAIYACIYNGIDWTEQLAISPLEVQLAHSPSVDMDVSGNAIVVYSQEDETPKYTRGVYAIRYSFSKGWQLPEILGPVRTIMNISDAEPIVRFDGRGNAHAVWRQPEEGEISTSYYKLTSGWTPSSPIPTPHWFYPTHYQPPALAVESSGNAIVVWTDEAMLHQTIIASRFNPDIGWEEGKSIGDFLASAESADVAFYGDGRALTVWAGAEPYAYSNSIWFREFLPGEGWRELDRGKSIVNNLIGDTFEPRIAIAPNATTVVVYLQNDNLFAAVAR